MRGKPMTDARCFCRTRKATMSDEKRPTEEKELKETDLDKVSGGRVEAERSGRGIAPEGRDGGAKPDEILGGGW